MEQGEGVEDQILKKIENEVETKVDAPTTRYWFKDAVAGITDNE